MQEFWQPWQHLVDRLAKMPIWEVMRDEFARGYNVIVPGDEPWFPAADWHSTSVVSKSLTEVRIIAINAEKRNQGALHRMVDSIVVCGLCPVIVGPVSPHMLGILRHWGWHREVVDDGEERWRPQIIDGKIEPWGSGRSG